MPKAPPRPCNQPRCSKMAVDKGRCEEHPIEAWASNKGKSRHDRGYGSDWEKIRRAVIERDGHLCQNCLGAGIFTSGNQVDHIIPKYLGGNDAPTNLQLLCVPCHTAKTQEESINARNN